MRPPLNYIDPKDPKNYRSLSLPSTSIISEKSQYDQGLLPGMNIEEYRAQRQPWQDKLGNGLANMGISAFTGAASNTVGLVYGALSALGNMDLSNFWDNEFSQSMNSITNAVRESNPFYYSEAEKQASVLGGMGYQNFWFDKVMGGAGYTVGSMISGMGAARLFNLGKSARLAQLSIDAEATAAAEGLQGAAITKQRWDIAKELGLGISMANGESTMEALDTAEQTKQFYEEARAKGQRLLPDGTPNPEFDPEFEQYADLTDAQINQFRKDAGNTNYLLNMAITGGTNFMLLGKWVNPGKRAAIKEYNEIGKTVLTDGTTQYFDRVAAQKGRAFFNGVGSYFKGGLEESSQEFLQFASNIASQEYVKLHSFGKQDWFSSLTSSLAEGISKAATEKEGLEAALIGGITGAPFGIKGARAERVAKDQSTKILIDALNEDPEFAKANPKVTAFVSSYKKANEAEAELQKGDLFKAKNAADISLNEYIKSQIDQGTTDYWLTRLESLKDVGEEELSKYFGEGTTVQDIDKIIEKTKTLQALNDNITTLYGVSGGTEQERIFNKSLRDRFFFSAATIKDVESRISNMEKELMQSGDPALSNLVQLRKTIFSLDKTKIPDNLDKLGYDKYVEDLFTQATDAYNKALQSYIDNNPVDASNVINYFADLNKLENRKQNFIKYYNALNDPAKAKNLMEAEAEILKNLEEEVTKEEKEKEDSKNAEKEANLPDNLINDVFKKDVTASNKVVDLNGNELDLAKLSDADLRGLRDEVEQSVGVMGITESNAALQEAIEKELDKRDGVITAESLKEELAKAKTPEEVDKIVAKAAENDFVVSSDKVAAIHEELLRRKREKEAADSKLKNAVSNFKDIREFTNSFVMGTPDGVTRDEMQDILDYILLNEDADLEQITLKVTKNPNPPTVTKIAGVEYSASSSPLIMAIQFAGEDIAYIPYFGKFVNDSGQILDPTVMNFAEWVELFKVDRNKQTPENFENFKQTFLDSRQFFVYLNENLAKGKSEYTNQELKDLLNPKVNIGVFDIVGASPETALSTGQYEMYRDENGDVLIMDTRAENSENYTSAGNVHIDSATLTTAEKYKAAIDALAERKAAGKINQTSLKQRYVALVATPHGTISIPGETQKFEWMPVTPAQYPIENLLAALKQYQANKTDSEQIAKELNSSVFFSLITDWNVGLFMNPEHTDFILKLEYKGEAPVFIRIPITEDLTPEQFIEKLNQSIFNAGTRADNPVKIGNKKLHKAIAEVTDNKGITANNFRVQIDKNLPDVTSDEAMESFYSILSPNIKRKLSLNFKFNAPAVAATQPVGNPTVTQPSTTPVSPIKTALTVLLNKIKGSSNPKITLNNSIEAFKKYGFTDTQIKGWKQVFSDSYITAAEAIQALIDRTNGKERDFPLDDALLDSVLAGFEGREQDFLNVVQGVKAKVSEEKYYTYQGSVYKVTDTSIENIKTGELKPISFKEELEKKGEYVEWLSTQPQPPAASVSKFKTIEDIKRYFFNKAPGLFGGDLNAALTMSNWEIVTNSLVKGATQEELNMLDVINGIIDISALQPAAPVSDKKADIERRRQEELISAVTTPISYEDFSKTKPKEIIVNDYNVYQYDNSLKKYVLVGAVSSTDTSLESINAREEGAKDVEFFKDKSLRLDTVSFFWSERTTGRSPINRLINYKQRTKQGRIDEKVGQTLVDINAEYDAELAALEGSAKPEAAKRKNPRGGAGKSYDPTKDGADSSGERLKKRRNLTAAFAYLKSIFGKSVDAREFEALEENLANGKVRYGNFKNALIRLSQFSPVGTEYHEAFHAVFRMFLNDREIEYYRGLGKESLYQSLKKDGVSINKAFANFKKEFFLKNPTLRVTDKDLRNLMIEEHLADRFRTWKLNKEKNKTGLAKILNTLWEKLAKLLNIMVESKEADEIDALFEQIDSGKFKDAVQVSNQFKNTVLPADVSLYAGTRTEIDESGEERIFPIYLPEHITNQLISTVLSKVYTARRENPKVSYDTLIERAMNEMHNQFALDSRYDALLESTNEKAKDLLYSLEYALDKESWANKAEDTEGKIVIPAYSPRKTISNSVKAALKTFNFDIDKALQEDEVAEQQLAPGETSDNEESPERNRDLNQENLGGWNNLSKKLRAYISLTTYTTNLNEFFGVEGIFTEDQNITIAVDIKRVYNGIAKATQNSLTPKEIMTKLIHYRNVAVEAKPVIDKLLADLNFQVEAFLADGEYSEKALNQDNIDIYYAFVKGFNLHAFDHTFSEYDFELGMTRSYSSNRKSSDVVQFSAWHNAFANERGKWGKTPEARKAYAKSKIVPLLAKAKNAISVDYTNSKKEPIAMTEQVIAARMNIVREALGAVGIKVSDGYLKFIVLNNPEYTAITPEQKSYVESFGYNMKEDASYVTATFQELSEHVDRDDNPFVREKKPKVAKVEGQEQVKEKEVEAGLVTRLLTMAKNNEVFDESVVPNSYLNAENKTIYSLQKPTADSIITLAIARGREDLLPLNYESEFFQDHFLLNNDNFKKIKDGLKIIREDGGRVRNLKWNPVTKKYELDKAQQSEKGVTFGSYKARELAISEYTSYLDSRYDTLVGKGEVQTRPVMLDIMENASSLNMVPLPTIKSVDKDGNLTSEFKKAIVREVRREWDRIQRVKAEGTNVANKKEGFNWGATDEKRANLRGYKFWQWENLLSFGGSALKNELLNADTFELYEEAILEQIDKYFQDQLTQHLEQLAKLGVLKKEYRDGKPIYINVLLDTRYGRREIRNNKGEWYSEDAEERKTKLANMKAEQRSNPFTSEYAPINIAQVFFSNYLNRLSYNQLIKGDAAEVVKDPIDWFKRAKARAASGDSLYSEDMPETRFIVIGQRDALSNKMGDPSKMFTVTNRLLDMNNPEDVEEYNAVIEAIITNPDLTDAQKEKKLTDLKKNGKVDIADAQGWITAEAYMQYLHGLGKLTKETREIYGKIIKGDRLEPSELKTLKDQGVMGNSLKVVYYDGIRFLKLSVQLLSREETSVKINGEWVARPNMEAKHNMLNQMEQNNVHLAVPPSASKMLTQNVVEMTNDGLFTVTEPEKQVSTISNLFARLQQENPSNKKKITLPTQMETIIEAEQDLNQEIDYPFFPGIKTVGQLLNHFQDAKAKKIARSYVPVKNVVFALQNGKTVPNMGRLAKIMRDNLIRTGVSGQLLDFFEVDANGIPAYDFANMPHTQAKFEALYNAHFNTVFKQVVPGYKTTLQSAFGHQLMYYIDESGKETIVNNAMFNTNPEKYLADYKAGKLKTRELAYNKPRYDKNGKQIGTYAEFVMSAHFAEQFNLKPGDIIPEEIAYMFGVRIPSQDKHSAVALKLVDVLPGFTGSNAVFPHEFIKLMGHDFDIDSMYIHRPAHYIKEVNGVPKFMAYGNTEDDAFDQYVIHYQNDKFVSLLIKEYLDENLSQYTTLGTQKEELETFLRDLQEEYALNEEDTDDKDDLWLKVQKKEIRDAKEDLKKLERELTLRAMKELGLPSTKAEFEAKTKELGELNPSVLDNQVLNAKMALHTNPAIRKVISTPATISEVENILNEIAKIQGLESYEDMDKKYDVSFLTALMQALESNRAGQESIGAAVNATQIFVRANQFGIYIGDKFLDRLPTINSFSSKGYSGYLTQEQQRIMDILSTLTSAMTDNPKYGFVKKLGLTIDVLSNVSNLVSLGYNLKDALYLVNQDFVKEYTTFVANKQNPLRPLGEKFVNPEKFFKSKLEQIKNRLKELGANVAPDVMESLTFTTDELLNSLKVGDKSIEEEIQYLITNYKALKAYQELDPITRTFAKIGNVIKISKGTGATFEEEEFIVQTFEELGGKFYKDSKGNWQIAIGKANKIMPNVIDIFKDHPGIKANLIALADKRANTGKIAISQTKPFKNVMKGIMNNLKERLIDTAGKKNTAKKAFLSFLTLRAYRLQEANTTRSLDNLTQLIYKLEDQQVTLKDEYAILKEKYPDLVGTSTALFSLAFNPETSNGFTGIAYNNMKGHKEFEMRLTNDLENLYNHKETRPFVVKLFNYLIAKDALQFKNESFVNIMPAELFKRFSMASEAVKTIMNNDEATNEDYQELFGTSQTALVDEFMEMYVRDRANNRDLMYVKDSIDSTNYPVTINEDGSITFDLFKGWQNLTRDDMMEAIQNSFSEEGESLPADQIRANLKGKFKEENIETFLKNKEQLSELFVLTVEKRDGKNITKVAFKDGFNIKGGTYVLVKAESSVPGKGGITYVEGSREDLTGLKEGTRGTYVIKPSLGDFYNKVVPYGLTMAEAESITQDILKVQKTSEQHGEISDTPDKNYAEKRMAEQAAKKAAQAIPVKPGVQELFESNPELAKLGTPVQYSQYLDTIFPNSQVKDIVYHGTNKDFSEFVSGKGFWGNAFYVTTEKGYANSIAASRARQEPGTSKIIKPLLINANNIEFEEDAYAIDKFPENIDTILTNIEGGAKIIYAVSKPEQIHILGGKQDIEGFKKFVAKPTISTSIPTKKVISGVQTGVDSIGLEIAKELGYQTGGTAPRGFLQEGTKDPSLASKYGVQEISAEAQADYTKRTGKTDAYTARTEQNVKNSDGTVYFFTPGDTMGRDATKREANKLGKPFIENPTGAELKAWLVANNIQTLNVAGNRGSKLTKEKEAEVRQVLKEALATQPTTPVKTSSPAVTNLSNAKAEEAENTLNLTDPNALPERKVMEKNLAAAMIAEGSDPMSTPFMVREMSNEELAKQWKLKCFGK